MGVKKFRYQGTDYNLNVGENVYTAGKKTVYRQACFTSAPPNGPFYKGVPYCLKEITVDDKMIKSKSPGYRDHWDFFQLEGDHLRKIVAVDDNAHEIIECLKNQNKLDNKMTGLVLEKQMASADDIVKAENSEVTGWERLNILYQTGLGLQELYGQDLKDVFGNQYKGISIKAHRDVKLKNIMVEVQNDTFRVRLIDFASIRLSQSLFDGTNKGKQGELSPENTAPENILPDNPSQKTLFPEHLPDEKTDVFSLGTMLGEMFCMTEKQETYPPYAFKPPYKSWREQYNILLEAYIELLNNGRNGPKWIEAELDRLGIQYSWSAHGLTDPELENVKELFREMTRVMPKDRPSLYEVLNRLKDMGAAVLDNSQRNFESSLYSAEPLPLEEDDETDVNYSAWIFDSSQLQKYRIPYLTKFQQLVGKEREEGLTHGAIFQYCSGYSEKMSDYVLVPEGHTRLEEMSQILWEKLQEDSDEGPNGLTIAMGMLAEKISQWDAAFSGNIYIFTPKLQDNFCRFGEKELEGILQELAQCSDKPLSVALCSPEDPHVDWAEWKGLIRPSKLMETIPIQDWEREKAEAERHQDSLYVEKRGALYVKVNGNRKNYVLRKW